MKKRTTLEDYMNPGGRYPDVLSDEEGQRLRAIEQRLNDCTATADDVPGNTLTDWSKIKEMLHFILTGEQSTPLINGKPEPPQPRPSEYPPGNWSNG